MRNPHTPGLGPLQSETEPAWEENEGKPQASGFLHCHISMCNLKGQSSKFNASLTGYYKSTFIEIRRQYIF